jgi:hypothetical protein
MNVRELPYFVAEEPIPNLRVPARAGALRGLSLLSAIASALAFRYFGAGHDWLLPGVFFGLLVLLPWCVWCRFATLQTLACVVLAPVGYMVAVQVYLVFPFSGFLGCALMFAPGWIDSHRKIQDAIAWATVIGTLVGMCFWAFAFAPFAVALWQLAVAWAMSWALECE